MAGNKVVFILAPDWQMIYVNGKLEMQDHRLLLQDVMPVMVREGWLKNMQFEVRHVDYDWVENPPIELKD